MRQIAYWLACAASLLSACAGPKIAGNEIGGVVPLAGISREQVLELARSHCAKYRRSPRMLGTRAEEGLKAVFECI
jgi:hypothetical protein